MVKPSIQAILIEDTVIHESDQFFNSVLVEHVSLHLSRLMGKPTICICENKDADQLRSNCEADQRLCFRYMDSTIPLVSKYKISSL